MHHIFSIPKEKSFPPEKFKEWKEIHNPTFLSDLFEFYYCGFVNSENEKSAH